MKIELELNEKKYLLIGIPLNTEYSEICHPNKEADDVDEIYSVLRSWPKNGGLSTTELSEGYNFNGKIINTITNIAEEECKNLVEIDEETSHWEDVNDVMYKNYLDDTCFSSAKKSFLSLLKSKSILAQSFTEKPKCYNYTFASKIGLVNKTNNDKVNEYKKLPEELILIEIL